MEESAPGNVVSMLSQQPFNYSDLCVELGVTVGYNQAAHAGAVRDMKRFLSALFLLK